LQLISAQNVLYQLDIPKAGQYLPDVALLEFLLDVKSPVIKTVEECMLMYSDLTLNLFWEGKRITLRGITTTAVYSFSNSARGGKRDPSGC